MGQTCVKCFKADNTSDRSSVYELPARSINNRKEKDGGKKKKKRLRWRKGRRGQTEREEQAIETAPVPADRSSDDDVISVHNVTVETQESGHSEAEMIIAAEVHQTPAVTDPGVLTSPAHSVSHSSDDVVQSSVLSLSDSLFNIIQTPVHSGSDTNQDIVQDPVSTESDLNDNDSQTSFTRESDWETEIQQTPIKRTSDWEAENWATRDSQSEEKLEDEEQENESIEEINSCLYEIGTMLGKGGFGTVYEGTRLSDGWKVALKYVDKTEDVDYISIPDYPEPIPREVALLILANEGDDVPAIIQLLDWQDYENYYVMVLERFTPCEDVNSFVRRCGGRIDEKLARDIFWQATAAAEVSCRRGVFHRDIKTENLLINPDTLEVKLINFGCGDLLKTSAYKTYMGTREYICPEFFETVEYNGKPATVYSLGVLLFVMVCGEFPDYRHLFRINEKMWYDDGLSTECCSLIQSCLQGNPEERMLLENILKHQWFQDNDGVLV